MLVYYCEVEQENKDSGMLKGTYPENPDLWIHPEVPPAFFFVSLPVWCDVKERFFFSWSDAGHCHRQEEDIARERERARE